MDENSYLQTPPIQPPIEQPPKATGPSAKMVGIMIVSAITMLFIVGAGAYYAGQQSIRNNPDIYPTPVVQISPVTQPDPTLLPFVSDPTNKPAEKNLSLYFNEQIGHISQERHMIPIEGFSPALLIQMLPGMQESDFANAEAIQGMYRYQNGKLSFEKNAEPMHSARDALSQDGYATVLGNLSQRLGIPLTDSAAVDQILNQIK